MEEILKCEIEAFNEIRRSLSIEDRKILKIAEQQCVKEIGDIIKEKLSQIHPVSRIHASHKLQSLCDMIANDTIHGTHTAQGDQWECNKVVHGAKKCKCSTRLWGSYNEGISGSHEMSSTAKRSIVGRAEMSSDACDMSGIEGAGVLNLAPRSIVIGRAEMLDRAPRSIIGRAEMKNVENVDIEGAGRVDTKIILCIVLMLALGLWLMFIL